MSQQPSSRRRRNFLAAGFAGLVAIAAGGSFAGHRYATGRAGWIEEVVRRNLPGVRLDEPSLAAFVRDVLRSDLLTPRKVRLIVLADSTLPALARRVPPARERIERLERLVLSEFLIGSNFFRVADARSATIFYAGKFPACGNPFARLV